jgi:membrane protease YdiL (CAAX protease family)
VTLPPAPSADGSGQVAGGVPWAGARAVVDVIIIYVVAQILAGIAVVVVTRGPSESALPLLLVISPLATLVVALAWLGLRYQGRLAPIGGRRSARAGDVVVGLWVGVACLLGQRAIVLVIEVIADRAGIELPVVQEAFRMIAQRPDAAPLLVLTTVLLAPVAEETVFRGILFQGLRARTGFWPAALASGALFTLAHLGEGGGWLAAIVITSGIMPLGILFAALVERRGSLVPSVVAHATYNAIGVAALIVTSGQL